MNKKRKVIISIAVVGILFFGIFRVVKLEKNNKEIYFETVSSLEAVSLIVPHHLVAEKLIDEAFVKITEKNKKAKIERIILISPNHFNLGRGWVIASDKIWETKNGQIEADAIGLEKIRNTEGVNVEKEAFQKEHGIENILPFVAKYFSGAKVIPLMIKDGFPLEKSKNLAGELARNFPENTLVILSSDFSHELEKNMAEFHNQKTIEVIENKEYEKIGNLDTDCAPGLVIANKYSQDLGYENFELIDDSNSSEIYGKNFIGETTSYITGIFSKGKQINQNKTTHLMFFGDWMLDRNNRTLAEKNSAIWLSEKLRRIFWSQDENIFNLEGAITDNPSTSVGTNETQKGHFSFTFSPEKTKSFLLENKIGLVSLGNNHSLNFGKEGLEQTKNNLKNYGVEYFGDPIDENSFISKEINGEKIGFVNFNQFSAISLEKTIENIKKLKKENNFVIVYTHWGQEYQLKENEKQRVLAHHFVDSGADLIIGSHPHVVQPLEIYKSKAIFYSLGNFVFDQYFSQDVKNRLAVAVAISKEKTEFVLEPLYTEINGQVFLSNEAKRKDLLDRIAENSTVSNETKNAIKLGHFSIENN